MEKKEVQTPKNSTGEWKEIVREVAPPLGEFLNKAGAGIGKLLAGCAALIAAFQTTNVVSRVMDLERKSTTFEKVSAQIYWTWAKSIFDRQPILRAEVLTADKVLETLRGDIQVVADKMEMVPGGSTFYLKEGVAKTYSKKIAAERDADVRLRLLSQALKESQNEVPDKSIRSLLNEQ